MSRFRERNCLYYQITGTDFIQQEIESLAQTMCEVFVQPSIFRMDSIMVEANYKKMSCMEIVYTAIKNVCYKHLNKRRNDPPIKFFVLL